MKGRFLMMAAAVVATSAAQAQSQDVVQPDPKGVVTFEHRVMNFGGPQNVEFISTEAAVGGKVVKGSPYSAEAVTEHTQTLGDGNRISTKSSAATYRDSEGRTRREMMLAGPGSAGGGDAPAFVMINDPVANASYHLDLKNKTARKLPAMPVPFGIGAPAPGFGAVNVLRSRTPGEAGTKALPADRPAIVTFTQATGATGGAVGFKTVSDPKVENLGKRVIDGVEADGTRSTTIIPAGEIGNEREIRIVSERWYSPELQTVVMSTHSDPRLGETTYKLTNLKRAEPLPSLFQIPPDFTINNDEPRVQIMRKTEQE